MGNAIGFVAVLLIAAGVIYGLAAFVTLGRLQRASADQMGRADQIMAGLFDGSPQVTYISDFRNVLPVELLTAEAGKRGYRLSQTVDQNKYQKALIFDRVD